MSWRTLFIKQCNIFLGREDLELTEKSGEFIKDCRDLDKMGEISKVFIGSANREVYYIVYLSVICKYVSNYDETQERVQFLESDFHWY